MFGDTSRPAPLISWVAGGEVAWLRPQLSACANANLGASKLLQVQTDSARNLSRRARDPRSQWLLRVAGTENKLILAGNSSAVNGLAVNVAVPLCKRSKSALYTQYNVKSVSYIL